MGERVTFEGRNMKRYLIGFLILAFLVSLGSQHMLFSKTPSPEKSKEKGAVANKDSTINWYKYDDGLAKAKKDKKHVMVHFYTNWCGWCKRMDKLTFDNEGVRNMLNGDFVAVKVNAESAEKVQVDGKDMTLRQLAATYNARAYPDTWFLKPTGERIGERKGYVEADEFQYILTWVKDDLYDKVTFPEFVKQQQEKQDSDKK
jgi:thioredoxin-related protein